MWFLGHFGLGFLAAYILAMVSGEQFVIPVVLFLSMLPDLDAFAIGYVVHRGPTHSVFSLTAVCLVLYFGLGFGLPYCAAVASHAVGDYLVPPCRYLWPFSRRWFGAPRWLRLSGRTETIVEVLLFMMMILIIALGIFSGVRSPFLLGIV